MTANPPRFPLAIDRPPGQCQAMKAIILAQTVICAAMHGVAYFTLPLKGSNVCKATYTDGTTEAGEIPAALAAQVRAYHAYQTTEAAPSVEEPNGFAPVREIQSHRAKVEA